MSITEQEIAHERAIARRERRHPLCQCVGLDMPGTCPGPANCPLVGEDEPEETEDE